MSEIAKCPRCGELPRKRMYQAGGVGFYCCGNEAYGATYWNQYAAAMELVKAEVAAYSTIETVPLDRRVAAINASEDKIFQAKMRVLEVF